MRSQGDNSIKVGLISSLIPRPSTPPVLITFSISDQNLEAWRGQRTRLADFRGTLNYIVFPTVPVGLSNIPMHPLSRAVYRLRMKSFWMS